MVQEELENMLDLGVVEESHSDWVNLIVLVPKTGGSVRFDVDYRKLNPVSKFDAYPMPWIDEFLGWLGAARFYLISDLTKGYWKILLTPLFREKTSFRVVQSTRNVSAINRQNPCWSLCIWCCLPQ